MAGQEHIHIVTAGVDTHAAFLAAIRNLPSITHAFVFADADIFSILRSDAGKAGEFKAAVRKAADQTKSSAASLSIPCHIVYVVPPAFPSARDNLLKIRRDHPGAVFTVDITAGSKDISIALFQLSLWCRGGIWYRSSDRKGGGVYEPLALPKPAIPDLNPNYQRILEILRPVPGQETRTLPRSYLFNQMEPFYVPVRKTGVRMVESPTKTDVFTGKHARIPVLSQGTFTNILSTMQKAGLIRETGGKNRKEKLFRITTGGELALQFVSVNAE